MNELVLNGFKDELQKLASGGKSSERKDIENLYSAMAGLGGIVPGALLGTFAGGKGRRGRGALLGALIGAGISAAKGKYDSSRGIDNLKKGFGIPKNASQGRGIHSISKAIDSPQRSAAEGATALGTIGALAGLLAGKKGKRLKRLLAGGTLGAGIGGLGHLYSKSDAMSDLIDFERSRIGD